MFQRNRSSQRQVGIGLGGVLGAWVSATACSVPSAEEQGNFGESRQALSQQGEQAAPAANYAEREPGAHDVRSPRGRGEERPFLREYATRRAPAFVSGGPAAPGGSGDAVDIRIATRNALRKLPRTLYGNNAAVWQGSDLTSLQAFDRLKAVNVSVLRFPGGSTSDTYHWDGVYPPYAVQQGWDAMSQSWAASTAEYMYLVRRLGAIPLITVNYGYATYETTATDGNVANAARLAADWVEYCNAPNDGSNPNGGKDWAAQRALDGSPEPFGVRYWEVGNETYGFWEVGFDPDGSTYAANFNVIADAMRGVDPDIYIGIVTQQPDYPAYPWTATVLSHPGTADRADFLVAHNYFQYISDPSQLSATGLLAQASQVESHKAWLDELVATATSRRRSALPYYLGEYNATNPSNPLQISLVSGLFISKVLGEIARTGFAAASLWDVLNNYDTGSGLGPGDHGFLTRGQPGVPDFTPRPTYYPFYFYTRNFGDQLVSVRTSDAEVTSYASTWTGGGTGAVVINESGASKRLTISVAGDDPAPAANAWVLTGASLDAQVVTLNGQASGKLAGGPAPDAVSPYVVKRGAGDTFTLTVPGYSVASVVIPSR